MYSQQCEEERLNSARSPLDQKSARLARSSPFTELYRKYEQTDNIRNKIEWIPFFLDEYSSWESKRRDDDTEYKNQLDEYFKFMIDIFPTPFPSPTRPVPVPDGNPYARSLRPVRERLPVSASGGQTRCNLKRSIRRKNQFKPKNKTRTKQNNKTRTKPKNKTKKNK